MGIDLSLLTTFGSFPVDYVRRQKDFFVANRLRLTQDYDLFDAIRREVPLQPLPMPITVHMDEGSETRGTDSYGENLTCCRAGDLGKLAGRGGDTWNEAALRFFGNIDPETWVVLDWE